jgi:hypothetical protein
LLRKSIWKISLRRIILKWMTGRCCIRFWTRMNWLTSIYRDWQQNKQTLWPKSASELYRPIQRLILLLIVLTFVFCFQKLDDLVGQFVF